VHTVVTVVNVLVVMPTAELMLIVYHYYPRLHVFVHVKSTNS